MPKYEDFKVGDTWICRDGRETEILHADKCVSQQYPISTSRGSYTSDGCFKISKESDKRDLMYKKETDMPITLINAALALPKRPNKELAMEYLREIYEDHPDKVFQLAALYNYFMPASPAKAKTDFRWVARSVGDNDARSGMNYVWVEGGVMVACNGHTLHQAPSTLAPGYYHPKTGEPCNCDYVYPAPPRVVPQTPSNGYADFTLRLADTTTEEVHNKHGVLHQHLCVPTDYGIQRFERKHILAALNGRTESRAYITTNADSPGIVIMDGDRLAIVMGARK